MRISIVILLSCLMWACNGKTGSSTNASADIYLVRHAEKADDGTSDPDLTDVGIQRAEKLADILSDKDVKHIFSSDYKRTRQTAAPLADQLDLDIKIYNPGDFTELIEFIDDHPTENILVVGHSNSTPTLCNSLLDRDEYEQLDESDYTKLFIVSRRGKKISAEVQTF